MALHDNVARLRAERTAAGQPPVPDTLQGVTKNKVKQVLSALHLGDNVDLVDGVFALLDNVTPSWFSTAPAGTGFCAGATTAHLACHIGILQRGEGKLDREGRDYWIKPLRELGAIEPVLLLEDSFVPGHVVANSPNSSYRLAEDFKAILQAPQWDWQNRLDGWAKQDAARARREFQAQMAEESRQLVDTGHNDLIQAAIKQYSPKFLAGYQVIYVDDGDGDRITPADQVSLAAAGVHFQRGDAMPDVLLWSPASDRLWVIEAVTSDGEVDLHKVQQLCRLAERCGKKGIDFTTAYKSWKYLATRQSAQGNVAVNSFIWIQEDPAKHLRVESFQLGPL